MGSNNQLTTVVGGRAPNSDSAYAIPISGIEQALKLAAGDMTFREDLFQRRSDSILDVGIELSAPDGQIIDGVPEVQLRSLVKAVIVRYRRAPTAREFGS